MPISRALFGQLFAATNTSGNTFAASGSQLASNLYLYANNPTTTAANSGTTFAGNGSGNSVWIESWATPGTYLQAQLTNGAQAIAGGAEDIWVIDISGQKYILTSGGYSITSSYSGSINSSIALSNLDNLVAAQPSLSYSATTFSEAVANDGSISNTVTLTLTNDTFTGTNGQALSGVTVSNMPGGLTATVTRVDATHATLALAGNATAHANSNDISNLTVTFANGAFTGNNAAAVTNATVNNLVVDFADPALVPSLSYSGTTLTEAVANDGSISNTITITLTNDTFTGTNGDNWSSIVSHVPAGLTAALTRTSTTTATLTLTGNATAHANANDISDLTVTFDNAKFTGNNAASVTNATVNNLVVDFSDPPSLTYSASTFTEAGANDGSISTSLTITLAGDTFSSNVVSASKILATNVPAGLTANFVRTSATVVTVTLTGNASSHANANDISNLTFTFQDGAFANTSTASNVTNYLKSNLVVDFADPAAPPPPPPPPPTPSLNTDLDKNSDTGISSSDRITSDIRPNFDIMTGSLVKAGQTARLLDVSGKVVGSTVVSATDVAGGKVVVPVSQLDDGKYTFKVQVVDAYGGLVGESPISIQIVTDKDGVMPSVELVANKGDYNKDGIQDWEQANVTQLPLTSMAAYQQGKDAPQNAFGAVMVGKLDLSAPGGVKLNAGAQLADVKLVATPATPLPSKVVATSPMFAFTVEAQDGSKLTDADPAREGLQVQTVISLPQGVKADAFMKFNVATQSWYNYANHSALNGSADGAALRDTNGDGLVDQIIITVTDGGVGDEDGLVNGIIVDPGMLADTGKTTGQTSLKDHDGVPANVELATFNHDFNRDGVEDWDQGAIAQLPLASLDAYLQGVDAPQASFGVVMVGKVDATAPIGARIDANGQLLGVSVVGVDAAAMPAHTRMAAPMLEVKAAPADGAKSLTDVDPMREGLQTQIMVSLQTGVKANAFMLLDPVSKGWFDYTNEYAKDGSAEGAALLDLNNDGLVDAVVITVTDAGIADDDVTLNGVVSLHGMLVWQDGH